MDGGLLYMINDHILFIFAYKSCPVTISAKVDSHCLLKRQPMKLIKVSSSTVIGKSLIIHNIKDFFIVLTLFIDEFRLPE